MYITYFMMSFQAIFDDWTDYMKKSAKTHQACVEKLLGAKSFETVVQIQSEYAKKWRPSP